MSMFEGFSKHAVTFLNELANNNNRSWFHENKLRYEEHIKQPSTEFAELMANELSMMAGCQLLPKVFRIHRDVRFSRDKTPYNTWIHMAFFPYTETGKPEPGFRGFYFGLELDHLSLGAGCFEMPKNKLARYRQKVAYTDFAANLTNLMQQYRQQPNLEVEGPDLKRVPSQFDGEHPFADLLRYKQVLSFHRGHIPSELHSDSCVHYVADIYKQFVPLFELLGELD
ncbi:DUF2461 domain-containing protein [Teredinibacter sp. KSP-S5-2]|uniref:DUF2461 domain-containing protein n=1 Tax=Teredinibacter sp. KSP-S5-2 TaxID=3034506 RepID=UPI00293532F0|nr:DUF2461 domain-containing protein [Teredinibacter sp. KSP-S5-2]WNO07758.1 DUF2461 domain-containing protein [Teredinibacter sp. KSP-S5-2]